MSTTYFRQIGPYEIHEAVGRGGMGHVFLAQDTRAGGARVALKIVQDGPSADAHETAEAEQRGAELQQTLLPASPFVPRVYEVGRAEGYLYIAMEYVEGEDLSAVIRRGPMAPERAVRIAVQLCQFLEEIDRVDNATQGASPLTLLHNDLKPDNVRITRDDRIKVLDFGAAKSLSLTRRVTRNQFYSTPYLSPECLDSGERDRHTDAWAVGAILYEMIAGRPAFRASNTRQLERLISSRRPPDPIEAAPPSIQAVVAKLLAPYPDDRYENAEAIREDLERILDGAPTMAEAEGWPGRISDEPATRRVRETSVDEPVTRAVARGGALQQARDLEATRPLTPDTQAAPPAKRQRRLLPIAVAVLVALILNESIVSLRARRLAAIVPTQEFAQLTDVWTQHDALARWSLLYGLGLRPLDDALVKQSQVLADRVVESYRMAATVWSAQWSAAAAALTRASRVAPGNARLRATLRYAEGHLHRIDGEARQKEKQTAPAQQEFAAAVAAFREAAALQPDWPDPFLGLARTFIYGIEDVDRGADAMQQAEKLGHTLGPRETAQLAYGYAARAATLERTAGQLNGMPQQREFLTRARDAYRRALDLYTSIATFGDAPDQIRATQRRLDRVERQIDDGGHSFFWPWR